MFALALPLPPSKNALHVTRGRSRRPTVAYTAWLTLASVLLWQQLREAGHREPDGQHWWSIDGVVWLPNRRSDPHNFEVALFDLLEGAQLDRAGRIVKPGALYVNDRQVVQHSWKLGGWDKENPRVELVVQTVDGPTVPMTAARGAW